MATYLNGLLAGVGIKIGVADEIPLPVQKCSIKPVSAVRRVTTTGKRTPQVTFPAEVKFSGSIDMVIVPAIADVLALINSAVGDELTEFVVNDGVKKYTGCKATGLKIGVKLNEECVCSLDFSATAAAAGSAVTPPVLTTADVFVGHNITLTGIANKEAESIDVSVSNGVKEVYGMSGTSRLPGKLAEGFQEIDASIKWTESHAVDVTAASLAQIATATIVLNNAAASGTFTVTLAKLFPADDQKDINPEDIIRFGLKYTAETIEFAFA